MPPPADQSLPPILPVGTQAVSLVEVRGPDGRPIHPRGALGQVVKAPAEPWHAYRVRFADGFEASLGRADLSVLAHYKSPVGPPAAPAAAGPPGGAIGPQAVSPATAGGRLAEHDLYAHVVLRVVVGSRAYGLHGDASDTDRRGVYLPPADRHWSLYGVPEQLEDDATQEVYWEMGKFVTMALKANPNVLEVLYTPLVEHATPVAEELLAMRSAFLSKLVYQTYSGYVMSQFRKLQGDLRNKGAVKWKHVMHLLRLLLAGVATLREGVVPVDAGEHRDRLLAVRRGEVPWDEVEAWRLALHKDFDAAYERTALPDRPDYDRANAFLLRARRSAL
jgi:hypothetical protein